MDVDIYGMRVRLQIDEIGRSGSRRQKIVIGVHHSLVEIRAAEIPAVDEEELVTESFPGLVWTAHVALHPDHGCLCGYVHHLAHDIVAQEVLDSEFQ